jgi:hypothetical protein
VTRSAPVDAAPARAAVAPSGNTATERANIAAQGQAAQQRLQENRAAAPSPVPLAPARNSTTTPQAPGVQRPPSGSVPTSVANPNTQLARPTVGVAAQPTASRAVTGAATGAARPGGTIGRALEIYGEEDFDTEDGGEEGMGEEFEGAAEDKAIPELPLHEALVYNLGWLKDQAGFEIQSKMIDFNTALELAKSDLRSKFNKFFTPSSEE